MFNDDYDLLPDEGEWIEEDDNFHEDFKSLIQSCKEFLNA